MMIDMALCLLGFLIGRSTRPTRVVHVKEEYMDIDDPRVPEDVRERYWEMQDPDD